MLKNLVECDVEKFSLEVYPKDKIQLKQVTSVLVNNLNTHCIGLAELIVEKDKNGCASYRSKERFRMILKDDNCIVIKSEELTYLLYICSFLKEFEIKYKFNFENKHIIKLCEEVNKDNVDEYINDIINAL